MRIYPYLLRRGGWWGVPRDYLSLVVVDETIWVACATMRSYCDYISGYEIMTLCMVEVWGR